MKLQFKKIDAFATPGSSGNPAGAVYLERDQLLTNGEMQKIAFELRNFVSEVGFVTFLDDDPAISLKYFSAEREVDFCGHATIAIMYDLFKSGRWGSAPTVRIRTNRGDLEVLNRLDQADAVFIMAPKPVYHEMPISRSETALALGLSETDLESDLPVSVINAGLNTLLVPIRSLDCILAMQPEFSTLKQWCLKTGIDIVEVFSSRTSKPESDWRVRVFCPRMGYLEDPATGSGNSAFGYYLLKNELWGTSSQILEQNGESEFYNTIKLEKDESGLRVFFGGGALVKIEGFYVSS